MALVNELDIFYARRHASFCVRSNNASVHGRTPASDADETSNSPSPSATNKKNGLPSSCWFNAR